MSHRNLPVKEISSTPSPAKNDMIWYMLRPYITFFKDNICYGTDFLYVWTTKALEINLPNKILSVLKYIVNFVYSVGWIHQLAHIHHQHLEPERMRINFVYIYSSEPTAEEM